MAPTRVSEFKRGVVRRIRKANPEAKGLKITWIWARKVNYRTGADGYTGQVRIEAPGFRPTLRLVSFVQDDHYAGWNV